MTTPDDWQDDTWGSAGSAVGDWVGDAVGYLQQIARRVLAESELVTTARLSEPEDPAAGNAVLIAFVALVLAAGAFGVVVRTRRQVTARRAPLGRADR